MILLLLTIFEDSGYLHKKAKNFKRYFVQTNDSPTKLADPTYKWDLFKGYVPSVLYNVANCRKYQFVFIQDSLICYFYQEKQKREQEEEEREKMKFLVSNFTEDQLDRYAMFRRSSFPKVFSNKQIHQLQQKLLSCCII